MKIKSKLYLAFSSLALGLPSLVFAQNNQSWGNFADFVKMFTDLGKKLIPFFSLLAFLAFVVGVGRFIRASGSESELAKAKNLIIWGIIGLFVMFTIWGIIYFLKGEFGFANGVGIPLIKINQ